MNALGKDLVNGLRRLDRGGLSAMLPDQRGKILVEAGEMLTTYFSSADNFEIRVNAIVSELESLGHDLRLFDCDFDVEDDEESSVWCGDWDKPGSTRLIITFHSRDGVEVEWRDPRDSLWTVKPMQSKQTHFFATKTDLQAIVGAIESERELQYVRSGLFDDVSPVVYQSLLYYQDLGVNRRGQVTNADKMFLVLDRSSEILVEPVPQVSGGTKYAIDMRLNEDAISITPSGAYDKNTLIAGKIGTISASPASLDIYNLFRKTLLRSSQQVGYARVCPDAMVQMISGTRMVTMGIDSPRDYDLRCWYGHGWNSFLH
jgi:hypothetical protein